jgi:hypothetical protein
MRKIVLMLLVVLLMSFPLANAVNAQGGDPAVATAEWLKSQQLENGSWNDDLSTTALAVIGLSALGEDTSAALAWMETYVIENIDPAGDSETLDTTALALVAVAAAGGDAATFGEGNLLAYHSAKLGVSRGENITDLCFGLIVLPVLGIELPPTAIMGLGMLQGEDGGFGTPAEQPTGDTEATEEATEVVSNSTVEDTAVCAQVLAVAGEEEALASALEFLSANQNEDGGWSLSFGVPGTSDSFATALVIQTILAAGEDLAEWGSPERTLYGFINFETGEVAFGPMEAPELNVITTALAVQVFRGVTWAGFGAEETEGEEPTEGEETGDAGEDTAAVEEGPALDAAQWEVVAQGFAMEELDTADDFLVTVIDPFNGDELFGVEIINWTAEYTYTPYLIEEHMPAEVLLWLGENDPTFWENLSGVAIGLLPAEILSQLPEDVQARAES